MKTGVFRIELSDEAEIDFEKSYEFYYEDSPKVAETFFKRINLAFEFIRLNPETFPVIHKDVRKYVVKKFPFVIYYRIVNATVQVRLLFFILAETLKFGMNGYKSPQTSFKPTFN